VPCAANDLGPPGTGTEPRQKTMSIQTRLQIDSRLDVLRLVVLGTAFLLLLPAVTSAATYDPVTAQVGTVEQEANGTTVVGVQGFKYFQVWHENKPASVSAVAEDGEPAWSLDPRPDARWYYDVDPLANGNLLVTAVYSDVTTVFEYDPEADERVWVERLDVHDTHDVDLINGDELLVAEMRDYNASADRNEERLFVYNRTRDAVTWEWYFDDHYPRESGGDYTNDWSHVNDVDRIDDGTFLASVRNMDQVIAVNRSTKEIEMRLGSDGNHSRLYEQHDPTYIEGADGTPTLLVPDSENDRVVEYARTNGTWERTWTLGTDDGLTWPRDADRLPNGNTLVTDTMGHRVIEVTPTGEIVWETYVPWAPYGADRVPHGPEPGGPTIREQNATGEYEITGSAGLSPTTDDRRTFAQWLSDVSAGLPFADAIDRVAVRWGHVAPWARPVWMRPWDFVGVLGSAGLVLSWGAVETVAARRRIAAGLRRAVSAIRSGS